MTILRIRGGDLDLVEYEFNSFHPGENINTCGYEGSYNLKISQNPIRTKAPGRIHLTVLDMNRFAPGHPGGGGIGFAIDVYAEVEVLCIQTEFKIDYSRPAIINHFLTVFSKAIGYTGGFSVTAKDHDYKHVGLGSTSTILTALAFAVNKAVGDPLSIDQLRILIGNNYVEETEEGMIAYGFETGVGPAVSSRGGMGILGDNLTVVHQHAFAENSNVHIVIPPSSISSAGEEEFSLLMNKARTLDYRDRELKSYIVMMDFIPALNKGDLKKMGDALWEMEFRGSKRAEIEHHSFELYQYMHKLRKEGLEFVGMSSVGPSIAVITSKKEEELAKILHPLNLEIAVSTKVNNTGVIYL